MDSSNWLSPLQRPGSVVALGKFDALHRGHRALAEAAADLARELAGRQSGTTGRTAGDGTGARSGSSSGSSCEGCTAGRSDTNGAGSEDGHPSRRQEPAAPSGSYDLEESRGDAVLLSFSGMAAVLGWPERLPLTAPQDRGRVLVCWAAPCGTCESGAGEAAAARPPRSPRLRTLPFGLIRGMSPEEFVALLAEHLGAAGVVAGRNYRFGYKAAGDADALLRLGRKYGMHVRIVDLVTLPDNDVDGCSAGWTASHELSSGEASSRDGACQPEGAAVKTLGGRPTACRGASEPQQFAADASTDLEVELPARAACTASGRSGSGDEEDDVCHRVSSSRIRQLLASGRVEAVEGLLGRKYRLLCALAGGAAAAAPATAEACAEPEERRASGSTAAVSGGRGGPDSATPQEEDLLVPYSAYQNQPPANGQYRALVRLLAAECGGGDACGLPSGSGRTQAEPMAAYAKTDCAAQQTAHTKRRACTGLRPEDFGPACATVTLSDEGLRLHLAGRELGLGGVAEQDGALLLVDFDACG